MVHRRALRAALVDDTFCVCLFRPVAYTAGATDEVSHSMGQRRVQLGMNVVATALPAGGGAEGGSPEGTPPQPEDVVLYFGIIDILQARSFTPLISLTGFWSALWCASIAASPP